MSRLLHGGRLVSSSLLLLLLAGAALLARPAHAQPPPTCPNLAVAMYARPAAPRKPGARLAVVVKVRNTGAAPLQDVGLRVTVPLNVTYKRPMVLPPIKGGPTARPVYEFPQIYWPGFSLDGGKSRYFRLRARISKCQPAGTFALEAAAYRLSLNCSTPAIGQARVRACMCGWRWV